MLDLMARESAVGWIKSYKLNSNTYQGIFSTALPEFKALRDFEWIGYPEMRMNMVQTVLASHIRKMAKILSDAYASLKRLNSPSKHC